jgi:hypothetical protein
LNLICSQRIDASSEGIDGGVWQAGGRATNPEGQGVQTRLVFAILVVSTIQGLDFQATELRAPIMMMEQQQENSTIISPRVCHHFFRILSDGHARIWLHTILLLLITLFHTSSHEKHPVCTKEFSGEIRTTTL